MFLECVCDMWPDLLEVFLTILWEESGKRALLCERVGHVSRLELLYLPVVHGLIVPCWQKQQTQQNYHLSCINTDCYSSQMVSNVFARDQFYLYTHVYLFCIFFSLAAQRLKLYHQLIAEEMTRYHLLFSLLLNIKLTFLLLSGSFSFSTLLSLHLELHVRSRVNRAGLKAEPRPHTHTGVVRMRDATC